MNNVLRVLNCLAIVLLLVIARSFIKWQEDAAYNIGLILGMALWLCAPVLALLALRENATLKSRKSAITMSVIQVAAFTGFGILPHLNDPLLIPAGIGVGAFCIPFVLNVWRLRALNRESEAVDTRIEPARTEHWSLGAHWRGELSLGMSFWVNGALVAMLVFAASAGFGASVDQLPLRVAARIMLALFVFFILSGSWLAVGVWRSATRHGEERGTLWAGAAKLSVALVAITYGFLFTKFFYPQLRENALIAVGRDPLEKINAKVTTNDTVLLLHGTFGSGSADAVRRLLDATSTIKTIALASQGGRLREASEIALLVTDRGLDTYVDTHCESACTFVFLAGRDRAATPNARIGFHRPSFAGVNNIAQFSATERMLGTYRAAGIPQSFLDRVGATDSSSMWYPSREEMEKAGVINRVSLGGETSAIGVLALSTKQDMQAAFRAVPMMVALDRHFPGTIDQAVQAAWNEHTQGAIDADVGTAARNVISERYPKMLAAANDEGLDGFASIMLDELKAAQAVSTEACQALMQGRLNIAQALSPELAKREHDWALELLAVEKLKERALVDPVDFQQAIVGATSSMSEEALEVVGHPEQYQDQPKLQCASTIDLYERILKLPAESRHIVLRGMFEAGAI